MKSHEKVKKEKKVLRYNESIPFWVVTGLKY